MTSLEGRLLGLPGVRSVGSAMSLPPDLLVMSNNYTVEGAARERRGPGIAEWNVVDARLHHDRDPCSSRAGLRRRDRAESPGARPVNEAFILRHFPFGDALGRRLKGGDWDPRSPWITIVGVVKDVPYENGAWGGPTPMVYRPFTKPVAAGPVHSD